MGWRMTTHQLWPKFEMGGRLWVKETFTGADDPAHLGCVLYRADGERSVRWRPSIYMPRWASRITLEVTDVRVERVQEISEDDALAEGIEPGEVCRHPEICGRAGESALQCMQAHHFLHLWDSINGKKPGCSWDDNPWVWVIEFRHIDGLDEGDHE